VIWGIMFGPVMAALVFLLFCELSRRPDGSNSPFSLIMNMGVATISLFVFGSIWGLEKRLFRSFAPFFFFSTPGRLISFVVNIAILGIPLLLLIRAARHRNRRDEDDGEVRGDRSARH